MKKLMLIAVLCLVGGCNCSRPQPKMAEGVEYLGRIQGAPDESNSGLMDLYRIDTPDGPMYLVRDWYHDGVAAVFAPKPQK